MKRSGYKIVHDPKYISNKKNENPQLMITKEQ